MKCPKCQFENISGTKFCQGCGNKLEIVCPKCGFKQTYAKECAKCGIVFNKFKKQEDLHLEIKRYGLTLTYLLFLKCLVGGPFLLAGILYYWRKSIPAGPDASVALSIFCVILGIGFILFHIRERSYFVSVTEKGINISNRKMIFWEDIYNVDRHEKMSDDKELPWRWQWIDIYSSDNDRQKIVKTTISQKVDDLEDLHEEIMKRVKIDIDGLTEDRFTITLTKFIIIIAVSLLIAFSLVYLFNIDKKLTLTETRPIADNGAETDIKAADDGATTLMRESYNGNADAVRLLLKNGADVNVKRTADGLTALWFASSMGHADVVKLLLDNGAEVDIKRTTDGCTPLMMASLKGYSDVVKLLIDRGAEVDEEYRDGTTALWMASINGHADAVRLLLENGSDVNVKEKINGGTALIVASNRGHTDVVRLLLENGADVNVRPIINNIGWTALKVAKAKGYTEIVQLLESAGAKE
jgi:hypothetical protein